MLPKTVRDWLAVLWPSFLSACLAEMLVFAAVDPYDLQLLVTTATLSRESVYSIAFFVLWMLAAIGSLGTWNLTRTSEDINQTTVTPQDE